MLSYFNYYESLSGIEIEVLNKIVENRLAISITTNPYQGLKLVSRRYRDVFLYNFNYYESLSGIEIKGKKYYPTEGKAITISITTNPYQGLK